MNSDIFFECGDDCDWCDDNDDNDDNEADVEFPLVSFSEGSRIGYLSHGGPCGRISFAMFPSLKRCRFPLI